MIPFLNIRFVDILDVFMVAVLVYYLYRMLKGTNISRIFWALLIMYIAWRIFAALGMRFCSQILGGIMSIGLIALVIVFQPEIRKLLLFIGTKTQVTGDTLAARCILPVTSRTDIDPNLGLRHRSAIGVTEQLDVISVIVSEETGAISYAIEGEIHHDVTPVQLRHALEKYIGQKA